MVDGCAAENRAPKKDDGVVDGTSTSASDLGLDPNTDPDLGLNLGSAIS